MTFRFSLVMASWKSFSYAKVLYHHQYYERLINSLFQLWKIICFNNEIPPTFVNDASPTTKFTNIKIVISFFLKTNFVHFGNIQKKLAVTCRFTREFGYWVSTLKSIQLFYNRIVDIIASFMYSICILTQLE